METVEKNERKILNLKMSPSKVGLHYKGVAMKMCLKWRLIQRYRYFHEVLILKSLSASLFQ